MSAPAPSSASASAAGFNRHTVSALEELAGISPLYQKASLELLAKIISTVAATPAEAKFRRVNASKLRPKLRTNAALKLLESIGFIPEPAEAEADEFMCMQDAPNAEQCKLLQSVVDELNRIVKEAEAAAAGASAAAAPAASAAASSSSSGSVASVSSLPTHVFTSPPLVLASKQLYPAEGDTVEDSSFVFFWRPPSWGSQWTMTDFIIGGVKYVCPEQWMMASKAKLFGDHDTFAKIMTSASPREHKSLGRQVRNFDSKKWDAHCFGFVVEANYAKFTQHTAFGQRLLATKNKIIAEASPLDAIWGIGMAPNDKDNRDRAHWKGTNLLGEAIMQVRERMQREAAEAADKAAGKQKK